MIFTGFYKKSREDRINILHELNLINDEEKNILIDNKNLDVNIAGKMAENHIGTFSLPFSVVPNILIDGKNYTVPMVTEEPSVVAACSNASKIIALSGGFKTEILDRKMIGHVALYNIENIDTAIKNINDNKDYLIEIANNAHPSIVARGGGAKNIFYENFIEDNVEFLVVYLEVDVKEAMGANMLNNMLEALKPVLENLTNSLALMGILSNYATSSLVTAKCEIDVKTIHKNIDEAKNIAKKIELASILAKGTPYRASTHNKGIFNGIDAVVVATGNDWRAIESGCHTFASKDGKYKGLSSWKYDREKEILYGDLTLPMPVATVGGSIGLNESVKIAHKILKNPDAKTLASIIVSVGLAQNFAALRALVTVGIQQGHMKLHAKSLALIAGAEEHEVEKVAEMLHSSKFINLQTAKEILEKLREQ